MSTLDGVLIFVTAIEFFLILLLVLRLTEARKERHVAQTALAKQGLSSSSQLDTLATKYADLHLRAAEALPSTMRYEISLADWGPDFTGEDDILPRWRWVIYDADFDLKQAFENPPHLDKEPLMLGNATTQMAALFDAMDWVDKRKHPLVSVVIS